MILLELRKEGVLQEYKKIGEIVDEFHTRGYGSTKSSDISGHLQRLTKKRVFERTKVDGGWAYKKGPVEPEELS